jgi:hypothetical protein
VIDAFGDLVDEGCLAVFGPAITDNAVPTREAIERRFDPDGVTSRLSRVGSVGGEPRVSAAC